MNGATCLDLIGMYECVCPPGWNGTNCEAEADECLSNPCLNGATCVDIFDGFLCQCAPGWEGELCEQGENKYKRHINKLYIVWYF